MRCLPLFFMTGFILLFGLILIPGVEAQMAPVYPGGFEIPPSAPAAEEGSGVQGLAPVNGEESAAEVEKPRDPFWPVGYVPRKLQKNREKGSTSAGVDAAPEPVRVPVWDEAGKKLNIRGISLIHDKDSKVPKYLAMVAGKLVETGDMVSVKHDDRVYRWRVVGISEEGVSLRKIDVRGE